MIKFNKKPILSSINNMIWDMPAPSLISWVWNGGAILAFTLGIQIITGLFLSFFFHNSSAFTSVVTISSDIWNGNLLRIVHANGASLFFLFLYLHLARNLYFNSSRYSHTWNSGVTILIISMATAFLGYTLPWGQMSFWGATVITGLFTALPLVGDPMVLWLWGGFSINTPTLTRFFSLHFLLPFIIIFLINIHVTYLHMTGSNSPLGPKNQKKSTFAPLLIEKDAIAIIAIVSMLFMFTLLYPDFLGDSENFNIANPMKTPLHIQPEWYYLFAYAILRAIPTKFGGVVALFSSILILYTLPMTSTPKKHSILKRAKFYLLLATWSMLTWVGMNPVQEPFMSLSKILTTLYFLFFFSHLSPKTFLYKPTIYHFPT